MQLVRIRMRVTTIEINLIIYLENFDDNCSLTHNVTEYLHTLFSTGVESNFKILNLKIRFTHSCTLRSINNQGI